VYFNFSPKPSPRLRPAKNKDDATPGNDREARRAPETGLFGLKSY
jgi:hypothetical protein